jgi:hypothetical protein
VTIDPGTFLNSGTLVAGNGGRINVSNSPTTNFSNIAANTLTGGTYVVGAGSTMDFGSRTVNTIGPGTIVTLDGVSSTLAALNPLAINNGTLNLTGGRNFTVAGGTLTNAGTLTVGNTAASTLTGNVVNNSGGTLQGSGIVAGTVAINLGSAVLPGPGPGNGPGKLTVGNTAFSPGGRFVFQVNSWTDAPVAGVDYGQLAGGTGASLDLSALAAQASFTIEIQGLTSLNAIGAIPGFDPNQGRAWTIGTFANDLSGTDPNRFTLDTSKFAASNPGGGPFALALNSNGTIVLSFGTPVPEPAFVLVSVAVVTGLARNVRRRFARRPV